uniref:Bifunctional inhibitor/plant lipid transfer protein/seed storage helical domain-containing protein n=1 Tax=Setaria viridis TaxID=4556 RepID=A0A4U6T654_SETVI|nr:hypothetical protein SEVIR_9G397500v2 [Setaria viridis]
MASKGILEFIVFALVFILFVAHQKIRILDGCRDSIRKRGRYIGPNLDCKNTCRNTDMPCVCRILTPIDEVSISARKRLAYC